MRSRYLSLIFAALSCPLAAAQQAPLTGDWLGNRTWLTEHGVTFQLNVTQFYQGVASGGVRRDFPYGGQGDYVGNVDFGKLCGREGLFLKVRAQHRFGENINGDTGAFLPAAVAADLPTPNSDDLYLTNVLITQALSETFVVFAGKLDTFDGDQNDFASGRGVTQFSNIGFVINPIALRTIPYATLGCGFAKLGEDGKPVFSYMLLNATDTAKTSGFDELFAEGVAMAAELRLPTHLAGMPGHQLFGATWNSREYVSLGQDPRVVLPNIPINPVDGSWSAYWNSNQYFVVDRCNPALGWGVFGRAGVGDDDTNPISWFLSFGVGGHNMMHGHEADTFGAGWFISGTSDEIGPLLEVVSGPLTNGQGVELFYNWQATPWLNVTPDLQVIMPARENVDTALAVGVRAVMAL